MRKYSGQAIAIIMVVLVVATVIGASLYSRLIKNRDDVIEKRESSRALEQADSILDLVISGDLVSIQNTLEDCITQGNGRCEYSSVEALSSALEIMTNTSEEWCEGDENSSIKIVATIASPEDSMEYDVGEVMALKVGDLTVPVGCSLKVKFFNGTANEEPVFSTKTVYRKSTGEVRPYTENDMSAYCYDTNENGTCDSSVTGSIQVKNDDSTGEGSYYNELEFGLSNNSTDGFPVYEVRIIPLYGKLRIEKRFEGCDGLNINDYKINAQVNCKGDYREKEVILPNVNTLGYPLLFDYTIYNANGQLKPS